MKVVFFSSFTFSYLNRARVLYESVRRHHPDWHRVALILDRPPDGFDFDPAQEAFDEIVDPAELGIPRFDSWLFGHDIVEACTAVKGPFSAYACQRYGADAVVYLDPDIAVFAPLEPVLGALEKYDVLLTPHQAEPDVLPSAILDNERMAMKTGAFNLGFVAFRTSGDGRAFAEWWEKRLIDFCHDDMPNGLFVDQRWCDLVPALFESVKVVRDPGCNVASWNLSRRLLSIEHDGSIRVNGQPLRFYHFTKLGPVGRLMTQRYAGSNYPVYEIWNWYEREVRRHTSDAIPDGYWHYGSFADGTPIARSHRLLYRGRADLKRAFPTPFASGQGSYREWLAAEGMI